MVSLLGNLIPGPNTVEHEASLPDGGDGPRWAEPVPVSGVRAERVSKQIQTADGRVVLLRYLLIWPAVPTVHSGDRITIDGQTRTVEQVDELTWFDGTVMHQEVWTT